MPTSSASPKLEETAGVGNSTPLLLSAAYRQLDDWSAGTRDRYYVERAMRNAESVISVLREMGLLNEHGIAAARAELGPLYPEHFKGEGG